MNNLEQRILDFHMEHYRKATEGDSLRLLLKNLGVPKKYWKSGNLNMPYEGPLQTFYVAGPYSADTRAQVDENVRLASRWAMYLTEQGFAVYCPHVQTQNWETRTDVPYYGFLGRSICWLLQSQNILMLPDWKESFGAIIEHRIARAKDIKATYAVKHAEKRNLDPYNPKWGERE